MLSRKFHFSLKESFGLKMLASFIVVIVVVLAVAGIAMQGEIGKLLSKPVVESFRASVASITTGQSTNLQWSVSGASSVSISPGSENSQRSIARRPLQHDHWCRYPYG